MRRVIRLFASIAALSSPPAGATSDALVTAIVPIQNWHRQGYCRWEMIGADLVTNVGTAQAVVAGVLSNPINTFAHKAGGFPEGEKQQVDVNPISGDPPITIAIDVGDGDGQTPRLALEIGEPSADSEQPEMTVERAKVALVAALQNLFAMNRCAKVTATIKGLPEQGPGKVRLYEKTQFPYTVTSPHFLALVKELTSDAPCLAGRALSEPLPYRSPRQRC
jgi:hypothetical protein